MQAINHHPHLHQFHLAKSEMPAMRRLASRITSFPRTLLVKSSWAFTPSTLLLRRIKRFGPPLVARQAPRSAQHSIITSAYRGAQRPRKKNPPGVNQRASAGVPGSSGELIPKLHSRLTADEFYQEIASHPDVPVCPTVVIAPIIGHDVQEQNEQLCTPAFWRSCSGRPHLLY
jgi:hypothetical protein